MKKIMAMTRMIRELKGQAERKYRERERESLHVKGW